MAQDLFAPRSAFQIGYEQPIEPAVDNTEKVRTDFEQMALRSEAKQIRAESTLESVEFSKQKAILDVVGAGLKAYGSYTQTSEAARKRKAAGSLFEGLDDLQAQRDEEKITDLEYEAREDSLLRSAIRSGLDLDSLKTELEIYTNKPIAMLGKSQEDYLSTQMRNDPRFVVYSNASRVTSPDLTDADHENYAFQQIQLEDRNLSIAQMADAKRKATKGAAYINFDTEFKPTIDDRYNRLQSSILATVETSSGNIDRKGLRDMLGVIKAENALLLNEKSYLGISDDDFQPVLDRVQALENFIQTTLDSNTSEVYWDDFRSSLAQAAKAGGNPEMFMGALLMTDVPTVANALGMGGSTELINSVMNSDAAKQYFTPISEGDTLREITDATAETVTPNTVLTDDQLPDAFKTPEGQDRAKTGYNYKSGIFFLKTTDPNRLQEETFRKQFVTGATNIVRALNTPDVAMSKQRITDAIVSTNMVDKLNKLEIYDKTSADTIRIGIRSQLQHQSNVNGAYLDNLENSAAVLKGYPVRLSWDSEENTYYITGTEDNPQGFLRHFKQIDPPYYKANFVEGKGLKADPSNTVFKNSVVTKALTARESINFINNQMEVFKKDGVEEPTTDLPMPEGITYDLPADVRKDTAFLTEVDKTAKMLGVTSDQLLAIMDFETIGSFSPSEKSGTSTGTGLIQFLESTAGDLGTTTEDLAKMTRAEQMAYVDRYFSRFQGRIKNTGDLYMAVHYPKGVGKNDSFVMYKRGSDEYSSNEGLDINNDGTITRGEALQRLRNVTANKFTDVQRVASEAIESSRPRPQLRPGSMNITQADWWTDEMANTFSTRMQAAGLDQTAEDVRYFTSQDEADAAERLGVIKTGDIIVIGTEMVKVD